MLPKSKLAQIETCLPKASIGPKCSIKTCTFPNANGPKFFVVEAWLPKTNESKFGKKYGFSGQMSPNSSKEIWFSHLPILFSANHDTQRHFGPMICKFPRENIGLQFPFSLKNLHQPNFYSLGNLAKEVGSNCT